MPLISLIMEFLIVTLSVSASIIRRPPPEPPPLVNVNPSMVISETYKEYGTPLVLTRMDSSPLSRLPSGSTPACAPSKVIFLVIL